MGIKKAKREAMKGASLPDHKLHAAKHHNRPVTTRPTKENPSKMGATPSLQRQLSGAGRNILLSALDGDRSVAPTNVTAAAEARSVTTNPIATSPPSMRASKTAQSSVLEVPAGGPPRVPGAGARAPKAPAFPKRKGRANATAKPGQPKTAANVQKAASSRVPGTTETLPDEYVRPFDYYSDDDDDCIPRPHRAMIGGDRS